MTIKQFQKITQSNEAFNLKCFFFPNATEVEQMTYRSSR